MKNIINFIKESVFTYDIDEIVDAILNVASDELGNKFDKSSPEDILDAAYDAGEFSECGEIASIVQGDEDEIADFIMDNRKEILKKIKDSKK